MAFTLSLSAPPSLRSADLHDAKYDNLFQRHSHIRLPGHDWKWIKAQSWQESRYDPAAVSPVGATGLMQIMPATGRELAVKTGVEGPLTSPEVNTLYGVTYMRDMLRIWSSPRPPDEHRKVAQASYNAGAGNIIRAQRRCGGALLWDDIKVCLPQVTGHHSKETIDYVRLIQKWYDLLIGQDAHGHGA